MLKRKEEGDGLNKTSHWLKIAMTSPWLVWGLVALAAVLKMDVITTADLELLVEILKRLAIAGAPLA
jgi:hypothetical protein